jgi:hypothetical protein
METPIVVYESKIPKLMSVFIDASAVTLWPFILTKYTPDTVPEGQINHEAIHIKQQQELWIIPFYLLYVYYWLKNKLDGQDNLHAYANIPFEVEAYKNQDDISYIFNRERHSWKKYIGEKLI